MSCQVPLPLSNAPTVSTLDGFHLNCRQVPTVFSVTGRTCTASVVLLAPVKPPMMTMVSSVVVMSQPGAYEYTAVCRLGPGTHPLMVPSSCSFAIHTLVNGEAAMVHPPTQNNQPAHTVSIGDMVACGRSGPLIQLLICPLSTFA